VSTSARAAASRLRDKYARTFGLAAEDVEVSDEGHADRYFVRAPTRPDLPRWDTGTLP
jgi:hypothetical protein